MFFLGTFQRLWEGRLFIKRMGGGGYTGRGSGATILGVPLYPGNLSILAFLRLNQDNSNKTVQFKLKNVYICLKIYKPS